MPATNDLQIPYRAPGTGFGYPVKAGVRIFGCSLVGLDAKGFAVPLGHADAVACAGIADEQMDNRDGSDGAVTITARRDVRGFDFAVTPADLNKPVYATDDATLTLTSGKYRIGLLVGVDDGRAWVDLGA